ncbi:hypothetical protein Rmet_6481 [Cupriavidus metallidurans CH34]|uniref:Uncharacterized protein n=1 Tax=Cupriavidus metallidurans (strain ATCC 43123 / DSM 2839 / NBRC 102507 / CH34) TaxID=266264 RepID=D3DXR9_CUPMC|nr:hypothetical protein Rmet_6481 [Cupriavidus metallidurans CH34]
MLNGMPAGGNPLLYLVGDRFLHCAIGYRRTFREKAVKDGLTDVIIGRPSLVIEHNASHF